MTLHDNRLRETGRNSTCHLAQRFSCPTILLGWTWSIKSLNDWGVGWPLVLLVDRDEVSAIESPAPNRLEQDKSSLLNSNMAHDAMKASLPHVLIKIALH